MFWALFMAQWGKANLLLVTTGRLGAAIRGDEEAAL